uniref:Uncharacterized protein n=1 Tax=Plectus sambesii TaxID=2011161 RepID=A0A914V7J8_9BILA
MVCGDGLFQNTEMVRVEISGERLTQSLVQLDILDGSMWRVGKSESKLLMSVEERPGRCRDARWQLNVLFGGTSGMRQRVGETSKLACWCRTGRGKKADGGFKLERQSVELGWRLASGTSRSVSAAGDVVERGSNEAVVAAGVKLREDVDVGDVAAIRRQ